MAGEQRSLQLEEAQCHSLMLVLLNGGSKSQQDCVLHLAVPLADACVTEWRRQPAMKRHLAILCHSLMLVLLNGGLPLIRFDDSQSVPLADACVTEWRGELRIISHVESLCHSLMLVLLNGG